MFAGKRGPAWTMLARYLVPAIMTVAYIFMALTAETDSTGQAWMAVGLAFVLVLWWIFRLLTGSAALARAIGVGDADRILDLVERELVGRRRKRARLLAARTFAFEVRGAWPDALAAADDADAAIARELTGRDRATFAAKIAAVRVAALAETGKPEAARAVLDAQLRGVRGDKASASNRLRGIEVDAIADLAAGRVAYAAGDTADATAHFQRVIDDIRAGSFQRAGAHYYAARIAAARGDTAAAARHRAEARKLAPHSWLARVGAG
jgi:tetratricopeptide (TPR) repeat protein